MKNNSIGLAVALMLSALFLWGCSSNPSKDELKQLETTQAEVASLTQKAGALRIEKASLEQAIKEKKAKLMACQDDEAAVSAKLNTMN
jgi:septal ring factor EnvC (AmiA/AmiB activator)